MRVLLTTGPIPTHLNLLVPTAWALRAAGHEVCVASSPELRPAILDAGLPAVTIGQSADVSRRVELMANAWQGAKQKQQLIPHIAETDPALLTWQYVRGALWVYTTMVSGSVLSYESMLDDLVRFARRWRPDLVIWDSMAYFGPVAARACGAAHVRSLFGPDHVGRMRALLHKLKPDQPGPAADPVREWLGSRLAAYGCEFTEDMVVGQRTIDVLPSWLRVSEVDYLPVRYVPYHGRTDYPSWLWEAPTRPRVVLTAGLSGQAFGVPTVAMTRLLAAVSALDVEVIATLSADQQATLTHVPDNVRVFEFVPLDGVLPGTSAIVHHLGTGTLATALLHGVPQVGVNDGFQAWGEPLIGRQLTERGVGEFVATEQPDPAEVVEKLRQVLGDSSYREHARQVGEEMRAAPSPAAIVAELEAVAAQRPVG